LDLTAHSRAAASFRAFPAALDPTRAERSIGVENRAGRRSA